MVEFTLKIGQRIFDQNDTRWGTVLLINNEDRDRLITEDDEDMIVLYKPDDSDGECEIAASDCYPVVEGVHFSGSDVCLEIHKDEFDIDHDYDYYCPDKDENYWLDECIIDRKNV